MAHRQMAVNRQLYGGYDNEFIGEVSDRFICQVCTKVLTESHLAVCCGQHFCESCLKEWFKKHHKESCPHCRAEGEDFNHVINKGLRREISQLKIRCSNWKQGKGCDWIGELGELKNHLESEKGCGFVYVSCPNKCEEKMYGRESRFMRMYLDNHLCSECSLRPYECEHCGFKDTYYAIAGEARKRRFTRPDTLPRARPHYDSCPELPLICPNKCGRENIKRKDMEYHLTKCPLEKVECPFLEAGCEDKVIRSQLDDHLASNQQAHILMMMKDYKKTKHKLRETEAKLSSAIATIKLLQGGTGASKDASNVIIDHSQRLSKEDDLVNVIVPKISKIAQSGRIWYSPPFYYRAGYKLCLALDISRRECSRVPTYSYSISIALCLLKGEYDHQLAWPMEECSKTGHLWSYFEEFEDRPVKFSELLSELATRAKLTRFSVCSSLLMQDIPAAENEPVELQRFDHYLHIPKGNIHYANDCLLLNVVGICDGCALKVDVI